MYRAPMRRGHQRSWHQHEIEVEHAHHIEQRVEARHDATGLDPGNVRLRQADLPAKLRLTPTKAQPCRLQLGAKGFGQAV